MAGASKPSANWTDAFPVPRTTAPILPRDEALSGLSSPDLLTVDVRRTDYEGGAIKGSINLPAHSFYMNRRVLFDLSSSNGRGPRCAAWFADYIAENGDSTIQSLTLGGGIKGWVKAGEPYTENVDGYEPEYWKQFD
ncbi:hypothetical protein BDU57DRAFT_459421 [Ampelomyces quisqualis]|uniref:Rhodanese domain-containing protein n=1 Tax=Ampelomyces quisqualis TaxID=50730 RepID=A0A6A5QCJ5_AMPQU|nr:hypothetical protein BDU57DRAFT_459421 [Ampelomyces quisqualis]